MYKWLARIEIKEVTCGSVKFRTPTFNILLFLFNIGIFNGAYIFIKYRINLKAIYKTSIINLIISYIDVKLNYIYT